MQGSQGLTQTLTNDVSQFTRAVILGRVPGVVLYVIVEIHYADENPDVSILTLHHNTRMCWTQMV